MKSYLLFYALADAVLSLQLLMQRVGRRAVKVMITTHEALRRAGHAEYARIALSERTEASKER